MIEKMLANNCAPAFAGIKPSSIASCRKAHIPNIHGEIEKLNNQLNCKDIYIEIICECEKRVLVMVYRKRILKRHLQIYKNKEFLLQFGYTETGSISDYIACLKSRLQHGGFPHEIGVFLGYPLHDIYCFINHRNEGCLLCGEWKVYHNAEEAQKLFYRFKSCKKALAKRISEGRTLAQIFC